MIANLTEHVRLNAHRDNRNNAPSIQTNALTALLATFTGGLSLQCYERTFFGMNEDEIKRAKVLASKKKYREKTGGRSKVKAVCLVCKADYFLSYNAISQHCSLKCYHVYQKKLNSFWVKCATCHASLGMPVVASGKLLNTTRNTISHTLTKMGVVRYKWPLIPKPKKPAWFYQLQIDKIYLSGYNPKFPEWKVGDFVSQYQMMTLEQRKAHNRKAVESKKKRGCKKNAEYVSNWKKNNKDKANAYARKSMKKRKAIDPGYRVQCNLRKRLRDIMKSARKGGWDSPSQLTGCTSQELAKHIEKQFTKGMTWANYGIDGWHVDHIMPCSKFDHTNPLHVKQCWHYTNLRPLWANENMDKGAFITHPQLQLTL
jgi:hypothetical protein